MRDHRRRLEDGAYYQEIERLVDDARELSVIHGDINPSNVLITGRMPRFIDWQAARYGPFYLDLPHHLNTPAKAAEYRRFRTMLGTEIQPGQFTAGYKAAARYTGLRYIWWTLDLWQQDSSDALWVRCYLDLITR